jgi:hypothetical protein
LAQGLGPIKDLLPISLGAVAFTVLGFVVPSLARAGVSDTASPGVGVANRIIPPAIDIMARNYNRRLPTCPASGKQTAGRQ